MSKKKDPRVCLLDDAVIVHKLRPQGEATFGQRVNARRFIFDHGASTRVGEMMRECVDLMVDNIEFARTPYPTAYFELDTRAMWAAWRPDQPIQDNHDERVGFLCHNGFVLTIVGGPQYETHNRGVRQVLPDKPVVAGMAFRINRPQTIPFTLQTGMNEQLANAVKTAFVFGGQRGVDKPGDYAISHFDDKTWVFLPELPGAWTHDQVAGHFDVIGSDPSITGNEFVQLCFLGGGDPMVLTTMLLLLNQPSKFLALEHHPNERGIYKGKLKTWKEHNIVSLHLDPNKRIRRYFAASMRAAAIAHDVKGHWKHYNKSEGCSHHHADQRQAWEPVGPERTESGDYKRYWCPLCLQRRTFTEHFVRGDATRGAATKEYAVKE